MSIGFYCTGRGTHDRMAADEVARSFPALPGRRGGTVETGWQCPECGLGPKKIGWKARRLLAEAGLAEADISALPF